MDAHNNLSSFDIKVGGLAGLSHESDTKDFRPCYQGMYVQTLDSPCAYLSQLDEDQNVDHPANPLDEFLVASLTLAVPNSPDESGLAVIPQSVLDEYAPWNSDNESVDDVSLSNSYPCNPSCCSVSEPDIRESTLANSSNPDHHVATLPDELAGSQDLPPFAVFDPISPQQATGDNPASSAKFVDDKSSQGKGELNKGRKRKCYRNDPACRERNRLRMSEYRKNPVFAERERELKRRRQRKRYMDDPAYAKHDRERIREYRKNPVFAERERERQKKYRRERRNNPVFAEREREQQKKYSREQKCRRNRANAKCRMERYQRDPVYAKGQRIYNTTYNRMKNKIGKEEASKVASAAREEYHQSVNSSKDSDDLPQTSNPAETAQNSNNLDALPLISAQTE